MALQIYQILRYRLKKANISLSTQQALEELENIVCYHTKIVGKQDKIKHINPLTDLQKKILQAFQVIIF